MFSRFRLALAGLLATVLCAVVLLVPANANAGAWAGECWIYPGQEKACDMPWNYWRVFSVYEYNQASAWFEPLNTNFQCCSGTQGYVYFNQWTNFSGWGYNKGYVRPLSGAAVHVYIYAST